MVSRWRLHRSSPRVEVEAYHGEVAFGFRGLLHNSEGRAVGVEAHYAVARGSSTGSAEYGGCAVFGISHGLCEHAAEALSVEYVVAEHQAARLVAYKVTAYGEGPVPALRDAAARHILC